MAEEQENQQTDNTQEPVAEEAQYAKLINGEMSLEDMLPEQAETDKTETQESTQQETTSTNDNKTQDPQQSLEEYKQQSQKEIERLSKIAKDNQAEFTRRSQELSAARAEITSLKEQLAALSNNQNGVDDEELKALDEYPDDVKKLFKKLADKNKALEAQVSNVNKFVQDEEGRRQQETARQEHLRELQRDFAENVLPKIIAEEPEYDSFMRQNMAGYQQWAMTLSEGQRFSFLNSKDPRDLIQGYREYKKFLNLPYETEAIKQTQKENDNKKDLYSTQAKTTRQVAASAGTPKLSEREAWELEIARQAKGVQ